MRTSTFSALLAAAYSAAAASVRFLLSNDNILFDLGVLKLW